MDILSFGEILFDIIDGESYLGGAPLNFAAHMSKLGHRSYMLSRVGKDELGKRAIREITTLGISEKFIQSDPDHSTGKVNVSLSEGQPAYLFVKDAAYDYIDLDEFVLNYSGEEFNVIYFGTLAQRGETSRYTLLKLLKKLNHPLVFLDINLRQKYYTPEILRTSLGHCDILKVNYDEIRILSSLLFTSDMQQEELARTLYSEFELRLVIITAGEKGCFVLHEDRYEHLISGKVKVKDTVGAGDAFSAAFLHSYLKHNDPVMAANQANLLGGYVATQRGAIPDYSAAIKSVFYENSTLIN